MAADTKPLAWVTGARGLIGNYIIETAARFAPAWETLGLTREHVDLTDSGAVRALWTHEPPQLVIHCAAMSKSPACQSEPALARKVNVEATAQICELGAEIPVIFFSTDLVFDGCKGNYVETDEPNPLSVYAETKIAAEGIVLQNSKHIVVRTSLNAGKSPTGDRSFIEEMRNAWLQGRTLKLFVDEFRSPIPAAATARAVWELASRNETGIFHLAGSERLCRYEIGQLVGSLWPELNPKIESSSLTQYEGAPRPPDTSLNCSKLQNLLSFPLPRFSDWIRDAKSELRSV